MKKTFLLVLLILGIGGSAAHATDPIWVNNRVLTVPPTIDALAFDNEDIMDFTSTNATSVFSFSTIYSSQNYIFDTFNTRDFTNKGIMTGSLGFRFDTVTDSGKRLPAEQFVNLNSGVVSAIDYGFMNIIPSYSPFGYGGIFLSEFMSIPSYVKINSDNIFNRGAISVGDAGLMQLTGKNLDLKLGSLSAGTPGDQSANVYSGYYGTGTNWYYFNPSTVQDIYAAIGTNTYGLPFAAPANYSSYLYTNTDFWGDIYINAVFVNTNQLTNVTYDVRFTPSYYYSYYGYYWDPFISDPYASEVIVGFAVPGFDVITGSTLTNTAYLLDTGAAEDQFRLLQNAADTRLHRPSALQVMTATPPEWLFAVPSNGIYTPYMTWPGNGLTTNTVHMNWADYQARIAQNAQIISDPVGIGYNDPTNQPSRIEISGDSVDLDNARIRSEGLLKIQAKHLVPNHGATIDAASLICDLGNTNGFLSVSNLLPIIHADISGSIVARCYNWTNFQFLYSGTNIISSNQVNFHVLLVDPTFVGNQAPDVLKLAFHATNVYDQDITHITQSALFDAENLTFNGSVKLMAGAGSLLNANIPRLKTFLNETNGSFLVDREMLIGFDAPVPLRACTNRGGMMASAIRISATNINNSGVMIASNYGSIYLQGDVLNLVPDVSGATNFPVVLDTNIPPDQLIADSDTTLIAKSLRANHSIILNGNRYLNRVGGLYLDVSDELSDMVSGTATTNNSIKNYWEVTAALSLSRKPLKGDLFGTQIRSIAAGSRQNTHVWAGFDRGPSVSGFSNNVAIGRLTLDRQSADPTCTFKFSGPGAKNAMYVDYLEFQDYATNKDGGDTLVFDSNFTLYFADCNVDPVKLTNRYAGRVVWMPQFNGPNSSISIQATINGQTRNVLVNRLLAQSSHFDSDGDGVYNQWDSAPFDGAFLTTIINGDGVIAPNLDGTVRTIGDRSSPVTLSAVHAPGSLFAGWSWPADFHLTDASGKPVDTNSVSISFVMQSNLVITANFALDPSALRIQYIGDGVGTVTPNLNATPLVSGHTYRLAAKPCPNCLFGGWSGSVTSSSPTLNFRMQPNTLIQAMFYTNNFAALKGTYRGLFYAGSNDTSAVTMENSGSFQFNLSIKGVASGKLSMASGLYPFVTTFAQDGTAPSVTVKRGNKLLPLTLILHLDTSVGSSEQVTGTVSEGNNWLATLSGDRLVYNSRTYPAPAFGYYTMALPQIEKVGAYPMGDGYGTFKVTSDGLVSAVIHLADGSTYSQSSQVSKYGQWPFYLTRGGKDALIGFVTFDTNSFTTNFGTVTWIKKSGVARYTTGFTNDFNLIGSKYVPPANLRAPLELRNATAVIRGTDVNGSFGNMGTNGLSFVSIPNRLQVTYAPRTGAITGKVTDLLTGKVYPVNGVVLQNVLWNNQSIVRGCVLTPYSSGQFMLQSEE